MEEDLQRFLNHIAPSVFDHCVDTEQEDGTSLILVIEQKEDMMGVIVEEVLSDSIIYINHSTVPDNISKSLHSDDYDTLNTSMLFGCYPTGCEEPSKTPIKER